MSYAEVSIGGGKQWGIPISTPSSGSIGANGAITLTTAMPITYPNIWLYFPAGALYANSAAGFYFCQMSSTTLGTAYNIPLASQVPFIPTAEQLTRTAIVSASVGAYTQSTATNAGPSFVLPAGSIGANGILRIEFEMSVTNSANNKTVQWIFGGNTYSQTITTTQLNRSTYLVANRGAANRQFVSNLTTSGSSGANSLAQITVDTDAPVTISTTLTKANATEYLVLEFFSAVAMFAP